MGYKPKACMALLLLLLFFGCKGTTEDFNPEAVAKEYCNCVKEQIQSNNLLDARVICDSKMSLKNRFFRLQQGHIMFPNRLSKLPKETADSVWKFYDTFTDYIFKNCREILPKDVNFDITFPELIKTDTLRSKVEP
ncbi:hypothetical protein [Terrimonas pollutisoli]|uniref:hypothetical protein n=1 Tax=Terrimonas pollutisoli TaxID=3034147 RepID=UPI0023EDA658|nr:hypothetical protein [Terrimonas sp. H1YJ31]